MQIVGNTLPWLISQGTCCTLYQYCALFQKTKSRSFLTGCPCVFLTMRGEGRAFRLLQGHGLACFAEFFSPVFPAFLPHDVGDRSVGGGIRVIVSHGKYLLSFLWRSFLCQKNPKRQKERNPYDFFLLCLVEHTGFEPVTSTMRM